MSVSIINLLTETNKSVYIKDPLEPEKGFMKAVLNTKQLFNAEIYSYLHGGKRYKLYFDENDIFNILTDQKDANNIGKIISQHHERLDGSGFPNHLLGKEILPGAAIIAVVDTYHNIFYRRKIT